MPIDPTEIVDIDPDSIHFVRSPASRMSPLLAKAQAEVLEVAEGMTESEAAMLASVRAGERMDKLAKQRHDTPDYDAMDTPPFKPDHDLPNSDVNPEHAPNRPGVGNTEVDSIFTSLMKEAHGVVEQASLLLSIADMKAGVEYEAWEKGKYSADDKRKMLADGKAIKNAKGQPSYPIGDRDDLGKAIHAVGRGGTSHNRIRSYIVRRANALGASSMIPDNWATDGAVKKQAPLYMAMDPSTTIGDMPGSPSWEAEDANRLIAAGQCLAGLINSLQCSMNREQMEVAVGNADDNDDVYALSDAINAAEYALGIVARLAFHEEAEATPDTGAMGKQERLTEESVDVIRQLVSLLKSDFFGSDNDPAGSSGTEEVDDFMSITKEDLAAAVGEGVALALAKSEDDRKARKAAKREADEKAETERLAKAEAERVAAEAAKVAPEATPEVPEVAPVEKGEGADPEPDAAPDIAAMVKAGLESALSPLVDRIGALEGTPQQGGPLVGAGGQGRFSPGARGTGDGEVPQDIKDLRTRVQKAEAAGDEISATRYRNELGQKVLAIAWEGMGYPSTPARGRVPQFTPNAAS